MANRIGITTDMDGNARSKLRDLRGDLDDLPNSRGIATIATGFGLGIGLAVATAAINTFANALPGVLASASNLNETLNKVDVVFGANASNVKAWGQTAATAMGMSSNTALSAAGTFGNLFVSMGMGGDKSSEMSMSLVDLAGDLASFNNMDPTDVLEKLRAGLVGETEPLRALGVNLTAATIADKAMEMGLATTTVDMAKVTAATHSVSAAQQTYNAAVKKHGANSLEAAKAKDKLTAAEASLAKAQKGSADTLSASAKAQATHALILEQTGTAQGDFARTSDALANQQRTLNGELENLSATVGTAMVPAMTGLVHVVTAQVIPALRDGFDWISKNVMPRLAEAFDWIRANVLPALAVAFDWVGKNVLPPLRDAIEHISNSVLPALSQVFDWLGKNVLPKVGAALQWISDNVMPKVGAAIDWISKNVLPALAATFDWIGKNVLPALETALQILGNVFGGLGEAVGLVAGIIGGSLRQIGEGFGALADVARAAMGVVMAIIQPVIDLIGTLQDALNTLTGTPRGTTVGDAGKRALEPPSGYSPPHGAAPIEFASGGIVTRPTFALIGESGPEAVIPLGRGGVGATVNVYIENAFGDGPAMDQLSRRLASRLRLAGI